MRKFSVIFLLASIVTLSLCLPGFISAQETITLTTYYPSPHGVFQSLQAYRLVVGDDDMPTQDGIVNFQGLDLRDSDPSWTNDGAMYYNSHSHRFRYYDGERGEWRDLGGATGPVFSWENVEVYDANDTSGDVTLVDIPDGSGVILGGTIAGFSFKNVIMTIDGVAYRLPGIDPEDPTIPVLHDADGVANWHKIDDKNDDADYNLALPSNILFEESLKITYTVYHPSGNRQKYGIVYIGRTD